MFDPIISELYISPGHIKNIAGGYNLANYWAWKLLHSWTPQQIVIVQTKHSCFGVPKNHSSNRITNVQSLIHIQSCSWVFHDLDLRRPRLPRFYSANSLHLYCSAKPKGSICSLYKWADTAFWLCTAVCIIVSLARGPIYISARCQVIRGQNRDYCHS